MTMLASLGDQRPARLLGARGGAKAPLEPFAHGGMESCERRGHWGNISSPRSRDEREGTGTQRAPRNSGNRAVNSLRDSAASKPAARAALSGLRSTCEAKPTMRASGALSRIFLAASSAAPNVESDRSTITSDGPCAAHCLAADSRSEA